MISECLFKHNQQLRWVLRTHLCNFVVDKVERNEAETGFIIQKYLDEEGVKMLEDLEHNADDDVETPSDDGFKQYEEPMAPTTKPGEYRGFMPKNAMDEEDNKVIWRGDL